MYELFQKMLEKIPQVDACTMGADQYAESRARRALCKYQRMLPFIHRKALPQMWFEMGRDLFNELEGAPDRLSSEWVTDLIRFLNQTELSHV